MDQTLPLDSRGFYEASLLNPQSGDLETACLVTGYPILQQSVEFSRALDLVADKEYWNKFVMQTKVCTLYSLLVCCSSAWVLVVVRLVMFPQNRP